MAYNRYKVTACRSFKLETLCWAQSMYLHSFSRSSTTQVLKKWLDAAGIAHASADAHDEVQDAYNAAEHVREDALEAVRPDVSIRI